jgi:hypothetical protein
MEIEEKKRKARKILAEIGPIGFLVLRSIYEANTEALKPGTFLHTVLSKMGAWCEAFNANDLCHWCPVLFGLKLIGLAEPTPNDQRYSVSFDAQRFVRQVARWAEAESDSEEWALYIPKQDGKVPSTNQADERSRARAA